MRDNSFGFCLLVALVIGLFPMLAISAEPMDAPLSFEADAARAIQSSANKGIFSCVAFVGDAKAACEKDIKATFDHHRWKLEYTQKAFEAHHYYTMLVFILVCALVLLGMWLSYMEFQRGGRRQTTQPKAATTKIASNTGVNESSDGQANAHLPNCTDSGPKGTHMKLSTRGIELTSPVLGVIILVISMGFFYLYLKTVYPIEISQPVGALAEHPTKSEEPTK